MISTSSNVDAVISDARRVHPQFQFACAKALTDVVVSIRDAMPAQAEGVFDRPTQFTKQGFFMQRATKAKLEAVVGVKDRQAQYLNYQVEGGARAPARKALRLPGDVELNESGNLPAGLIRKLIQRAKAGKRATKGQASKFGVSSKVDLFYGEPGDGRPAGIYKRLPAGVGKTRLVPVVAMPQQSAKYDRKFDFYAIAQRMAVAQFEPALDRAFEQAIATAK